MQGEKKIQNTKTKKLSTFSHMLSCVFSTSTANRYLCVKGVGIVLKEATETRS